MRVREAAIFLGVSPQTVYLWVERRQIPHLRVMGRNIRFLKSDLEPFRATFKQEVYRDRNGKRIRESTNTDNWQEAQRKLRERLQARDEKILDVVRKGEQLQFAEWADFFLQNYSKPPIRAEKTHEANERAALHLKQAFAQRSVADITADDIEHYLRRRLQTRVQVKTGAGFIQKDRLKPATVHQELRVLRRMLNVAVRKKLLPANPSAGVEFPVKVKGLFRPHYRTWSVPVESRDAAASVRSSSGLNFRLLIICAISSGSSPRPDCGFTRSSCP